MNDNPKVDMDKPMTLDEAFACLEDFLGTESTPAYMTNRAWVVVKAHLAREVMVTDEDVERAKDAYDAQAKREGLTEDGGWKGHVCDRDCMYSALESLVASVPGAARVPDAMKPHLFRETDDAGETARGEGYVDGWNACREAMLAQGNGGVRDGWKLVPVEPTQEMLDAHSKTFGYVDTRWCEGDIEGAWEAMLASAPKPDAS
jgi:hypothetical protein